MLRNQSRNILNFLTKGPFSRWLKRGLLIGLILCIITIIVKLALNDIAVKTNEFGGQEVESSVVKNPGKIVTEGYTNKKRSSKSNNATQKRQYKNNKDSYQGNVGTNNEDTKQFSSSNKTQQTNNTEEEYVVTPLNLYTSKVANNRKPMEKYAPYGRMIPVQLVNTIDTANTQTPIIGIVIKNVWHDGKLIIPAGAEVHGSAKASPIRDKVLTGNSWVIVWRTRNEDNGKELKLNGIALENGKIPKKKNKFSLTDMSAGIRGYTVDTRDYAQLKAIALKMTDGLTSLPATATGVLSNLAGGGGAVASGTQDSANLYADMMMSKVLREGYFVRVPAGTRFYLYVEQTLNMDKAKIGETLFSEYNKNSSTDNSRPVIMNPTYSPQINSKKV
ncbi:MAG TPA: TrbI/VirB10 family protein [Victivallales bacterium]|nr:TrbI/VirB10 family protein [Victivallales bacterium]